jgi:hypothetical protein
MILLIATPCALQRQLDLASGRLLRLLDEAPQDHDPSAGSGDVERAGDPVPALQAHFPQLVVEVLHMRLPAPLQAMCLDEVRDAGEAGAYIDGQCVDFGLRNLIQELNAPTTRHISFLR